MIEYKIKEIEGLFVVGYMEETKKYPWSKPKKEFQALQYRGLFPNHIFKTLEEAKERIRVISKPVVYHDV